MNKFLITSMTGAAALLVLIGASGMTHAANLLPYTVSCHDGYVRYEDNEGYVHIFRVDRLISVLMGPNGRALFKVDDADGSMIKQIHPEDADLLVECMAVQWERE